MIKVASLSKTFGTREVLKNISLEIPQGSFTSLLGPSGCGKTTLLRILAGLEKPSLGTLDIESSAARAFVFQEATLLDWRTVAENILLPFELQKNPPPPAEQSQRLQAVLKQVHLESAHDLFPAQLSGGMKMRVSLARALITHPQWLFLDEPFAALDEPTRFEMQDLLKDLAIKNSWTAVFVTHSLSEAAYLSDRIFMFQKAGLQKIENPLAQVKDKDLRTTLPFNDFVQALSRGFHS